MMKLGLGAKIGLVIGLIGGLIGLSVGIWASPMFGIPFAFVFILIFGLTFGLLFKNMAQSNRLLKTGEPAQATILQLWDTGVTLNQNPQIGLLLEVRPMTRPAYQAQTKMFISRLQTSMFQPGMVLNVRFDPNNPSKVAVESAGGTASPAPFNAVRS
ncbi:MAG: hypothetical protein U1F57_01905 [bacterium]